jgi:hypothetical protein
MSSAAKRSLRESLRLNAEKVRAWPAYLRVRSSAYYKAREVRDALDREKV